MNRRNRPGPSDKDSVKSDTITGDAAHRDDLLAVPYVDQCYVGVEGRCGRTLLPLCSSPDGAILCPSICLVRVLAVY